MHSFYPIRVIKGFFYLEGLNTRDKRVMFTRVCQTFTSSYPFGDASKDVFGGVLKQLKSQSRFLSLLFKFFFTRLNSSWRNSNLLFLCLWRDNFLFLILITFMSLILGLNDRLITIRLSLPLILLGILRDLILFLDRCLCSRSILPLCGYGDFP